MKNETEEDIALIWAGFDGTWDQSSRGGRHLFKGTFSSLHESPRFVSEIIVGTTGTLPVRWYKNSHLASEISPRVTCERLGRAGHGTLLPVHILPPGASSEALVTLPSVLVALKKQIHKELLHPERLRIKLRTICFSFIIHALYTTYFPKGFETAYNNRHL